jgi:NAD+ kinase
MDGGSDGLGVAVRGDAGVATTLADADAVGVVTEADAAFVVVAGDAALAALATDPPPVPVLPVTASGGRHAVARENLPAAVAALAAGDRRAASHPLLEVLVNGTAVDRAALDVTLMTREAARISEYAIRSDAGPVADFRADGVVAATPLGSEGYAHDSGGPVLDAGSGLAVVPVAPFATHCDTWVLRPDVRLSVERDESTVLLYADDREVRPLSRGDTVTVTVTGDLTVASVPE